MAPYVLVTGCDSGFGKLLVSRLLNSHMHVIACFHSHKGQEPCSISDPRLIKLVLDITDDTSVASLKATVSAVLDSGQHTLYGLVNNAGGLVTSGPVEWSSVSTDIAQMDLNFFGTVRVTKASLPFLRASRGRIVNVSSILGEVASPLGGSYAASKFALEGWSDSLRREMLTFGVRVSLVEPGMFSGTKFYSKYTDHVFTNFAQLDTATQLAYGEAYRDYCARRLIGLQKVFASTDTEGPVKAIMHALTSRFPKHRYRVGLDSSILGRILRLIPANLADVALTCTDVLVSFDTALIPVMPLQAPSRYWWSVAVFAMSSYNNAVLAAIISLVCFIFLLI